MFLNFIGSGSALNTTLGNNSAFIKEGKSILILDCGSTTFSKIQELKLLEDVKNIFVLITHRHPDHVASLGDLIFYANFIINANITVLTPDIENLSNLLKYMGVSGELYTVCWPNKEFKLANSDFEIILSYVPVEHVEDMECYGYIINYKGSKIYYSGDARCIPNDIFQDFEQHKIDYIYQDVCSYNSKENPHMYINDLDRLVNEQDRNRLCCMHYDEGMDKLKIHQMGFRVIKNYKEK
ncbi:MAG: hypothetical protein K0S75_256 [Clostridia bacterium]|jgi:ribonuclease BN (tRNA processing enzyme)|nr:hypothetical protein [Clostridia bacterium]